GAAGSSAGVHAQAIKRGCGVADAVAEDGGRVWGVVYEVSDVDVGRLDASEGYRPARTENSYWRAERHGFLGGDDLHPLAVWTYLANPQPDPPPPSAEYKRLIMAGARHWRLPEAYIRELALIEASG